MLCLRTRGALRGPTRRGRDSTRFWTITLLLAALRSEGPANICASLLCNCGDTPPHVRHAHLTNTTLCVSGLVDQAEPRQARVDQVIRYGCCSIYIRARHARIYMLQIKPATLVPAEGATPPGEDSLCCCVLCFRSYYLDVVIEVDALSLN